MSTLITFLGKSYLDPNDGYRNARYRFADGQVLETPYFGIELARWLKVDRVILLGTDSSMWDVLLENLNPDDDFEAARNRLLEDVGAGAVTDDTLAAIEPAMAVAWGQRTRLAVIPHGEDEAQQQAILELLAGLVEPLDTVHIDVTHGYRHLSMIGQTAARYLTTTHKVKIGGLWYGALDMISRCPDGTAPVLRLDGMDSIQRWVEAFAAYEASGDFSRFEPLLKADGMPAPESQALSTAWSQLQLTHVSGAARSLAPTLKRLQEPLSGASELFRMQLTKALKWVEKMDDLAEQQRLLAVQALDRGDWLRAAVFGFESLLTRLTKEAGGDESSYRHREDSKEKYDQEIRVLDRKNHRRQDFTFLRIVRNACTHGIPPDDSARRDASPDWVDYRMLMKNPDRLREELRRTLDRLNTR